jgi:hypothetical protein
MMGAQTSITTMFKFKQKIFLGETLLGVDLIMFVSSPSVSSDNHSIWKSTIQFKFKLQLRMEKEVEKFQASS